MRCGYNVVSKRLLHAAGHPDAAGFNNMLRQPADAGLIVRVREGGGRVASVYAMPQRINITEGRPVM